MFQTDNEFDSLVLYESIALCFGAVILLLFACEICEQFSEAFDKVDQLVGQLDFYLLPLSVQRFLPIVIQYSQEPFVIAFFGSHCSNRTQFKKVSSILMKINWHAHCTINSSFENMSFFPNTSGNQHSVSILYGIVRGLQMKLLKSMTIVHLLLSHSITTEFGWLYEQPTPTQI